MYGRRLAVAILTVGLLWLASATLAYAHAELVRANPPDGSLLHTGPTLIRLWFSEPVQPAGRGITVIAPSGGRVSLGRVRVAGAQISIRVDARQTGTYLVIWQAISDDTHPASGRLTFSVRRAGVVPGTQGYGIATTAGLGLAIAARWLHYVGYALGFGPFAFRLLVLRPCGLDREKALVRRTMRLANAGILVLILAEPVALIAQTASLGSGLWDTDLASDALASSFGRVLAQRLGAAVALWVLIGALKQGSGTVLKGILGLGLVLAIVDGQASHAQNVTPLWLGLGVNGAHIAAMGVWAGGLVTLLVVWAMPQLDGRRGAVVARFGQLATGAVAVLGVTGLLMAWTHVGQPANLMTTPYGLALGAKLALLGAALMLAAMGMRARSEGRARRWMLELSALLGVLALAGLLVSLPPPA